jgi:tetratricopeptide (TPR) repeat protein
VGKQNYLAAPQDRASQAECIQSVHKRLAGLSGDFAAVLQFKPPEWYPHAQQGSARFVGRLRELWNVHTALNPVGISEHENANLMVQLRGLGGIGKSLLATEYAKRFGAAYPGGIHWLRAHGFDPNKPMDPEARERERRVQIEHLALQHDVPIRDKDFREISRDLSRQLASGGPYLWVIDDLPAALDQERALPDWCAPSPNGSTLITTRSKDYEGIGSTIAVDVLEPRPALELLTQERKPQTERELKDAQGLAEDLGRHALALDVAGHFLLKTRDFAALRMEVTRQDTGNGSDPLGRLAAGLSGHLPGGHEKSIVATLVESVCLLGEQGLSLLRLACELHGGTPLPKRLAKEVFTRAFTLGEQAADDYLAHAVNQAEMHSLATIAFGSAGSDILSVHSLVRYTMQHGDPAGGEAPALRMQLREGAVSVLGDMLQDVVDIGKHARLEMEIAHARHLAPQQPRTLDEARLSSWLGRLEGERGNYREALAIAKRTLPIVEGMLGRDHQDTFTTRNNIAFWTGETGDRREALRLLRELLPDQERVLGRDHPGTLGTRSNIAHWTGRTGGAREALGLFRELLPDQERVLGRDHPDTLKTRNNMAFCTGETGKMREALGLLRELLPDQERVLGRDHPDTLKTRNNIAFWTRETGETGEALRLFRELLPDQERVLGRDHPDTLRTRNNISFGTGETGERREALRLFRELLPDQERVLGSDHPETLRTRNNIAFWTNETGETGEALRLFRELLPDQERVLGPSHPETLTTRNNISFGTGETGAGREALRLLRELLPDQERVLGRDHPNTLTTRSNIAFWTGKTGETGKALRLFRELLPDQERVLGRDHPDTLRTRKNIVSFGGWTGKAREVLRLLRELLP